MTQFGMQMPAAKLKRGASPDVYTALIVTAAAFLFAACWVMYISGTKVGKDGKFWELQDPKSIKIHSVK
jgi:hypothetical protein